MTKRKKSFSNIVDDIIRSYNIIRNIELYKKMNIEKGKPKTILRKHFCVYRLYKQYNLSPYYISKLLGMNDSQYIKIIIGKIFTYLCDSSRCWAYDLLHQRKGD